MRLSGSFFPLFVIILSVRAWASPCVPQAPKERMTVILSDTHFGVGRTAQGGPWHAFEDFRWAEDFQAFLKAVDERGRGATDLVLNGDTYELWQSLESDCGNDRDEDYGCTEAEALKRIQRVIGEHEAEMKALGEFASSGGNRVVIVPGNHDAALLFPAVADEAVRRIPAPAGRVCVAMEGFWLSDDRQIYAEHGHQIGADVNGFGKRWPNPFWPGQPAHLIRTWGERGVQMFYNQYEEKYPAIDNLNDEGAGITYGRAAEGLVRTALAAGKFLRFALFGVSWPQFTSTMSSNERPAWDVAAIRAYGDGFLVESFPKDSPLREAAERALAEGELGLSVKDLSDEEIEELCNRRAAMSMAQSAETPTISTCPRGHLTAATERFLVSRDEKFARHLRETNQKLVQENRLKVGEPFEIFVYSHTHRAESLFKPLASQWEPVVLNTGAWQRLAIVEDLESLRRNKGWSAKQVLSSIKLDDLPACYSFIVVKAQLPSLRYWMRGKDGGWKVRRACDENSPEGW
jgi:Calcineurin-like phosphoesterase